MSSTSTIAELSRLSGCSAATVSRALNNSGAVSAKARQAVFQAVRQTQYLQKHVARKRRRDGDTDSGNLIEVVLHRHQPYEAVTLDGNGLHTGPLKEFTNGGMLSVPKNVSTSFYRHLIDGVLAELEKSGHRAVMQASSNLLDPSLIADVGRVDRRGVLLLGEYSPDLSQFVDQCLHPLVLVDLIHDGPADVVTTDNMVGVSRAFDHVYALGHRKIGFVGKLDLVVAFAERYTAFKWKMAEVGLPLAPQWVHEGPNHIEATAEGVKEMLRQPAATRPTALLCANDCAAWGVLRAASAMGMDVPGELSVVGFDDEETSALVTPALTTVRVPSATIGRQAVRQLMIQIQMGAVDQSGGCRIRLIPELIVRRSTGPVHT